MVVNTVEWRWRATKVKSPKKVVLPEKVASYICDCKIGESEGVGEGEGAKEGIVAGVVRAGIGDRRRCRW